MLAELDVLLNQRDQCMSHMNAVQYALNTSIVNTNITDKQQWVQQKQGYVCGVAAPSGGGGEGVVIIEK